MSKRNPYLQYNTNPLRDGKKTSIAGQMYRGRVENNQDPLGIGRVQVRIPQFHGLENQGGTVKEALPWAPIAHRSGGYNYGSYIVPEVGEYVLVQFEDGELSKPLCFGSMYGNNSTLTKTYGTDGADDEMWDAIVGDNEVPEEAQRIVPTQKVIYKSPTGAKIMVDEKEHKQNITLEDGLGQYIKINTNLDSTKNKGPSAEKYSKDTSIEIKDYGEQNIKLITKDGYSRIEINSVDNHYIKIDSTGEGIKLNANGGADIIINKEGEIRLSSKNVINLDSGNISLSAGGHIGLSASSISLTASGPIDIFGHPVSIGSPVILY